MAELMTDIARRDVLAMASAGLAFTGAALASAPVFGVEAAGLKTWLALVADLGGRPVISVTEGMVWGFKPQADDLTTEQFAKRLYGYRSLLVRQAQTTAGGVRLRTKAWSFYLDPVTLEPVADLLNPYTGKRVSCPPLSGPSSSVIYGDGAGRVAGPELSVRRIGDHAWVAVERVSRFKPADTTWFKLEADMTTYACRAADLDRRGLDHIPSTWSHSLTAEWQTWMGMHGEPGHILFNGAGATLPDAAAISPSLRAAVERFFPGTLAEPLGWR